MEIFTIIGWVGAVVYVMAYLLLVIKKISSDGWLYHLLNLLGAICLIVNGVVLADFPNVTVNVIWAVIAVFAIFRIVLYLRK